MLYLTLKKYYDVLPDPIDPVALPKQIPTHHWLVLDFPITKLDIVLVDLELMDVMTAMVNKNHDPARVMAFVRRDREIPDRIRPYVKMASI